MLLKRVVIKRGIIEDFTNPITKTIMFRRVPGINKCYDFNPGHDEEDWEEDYGKPYEPDPKCKYRDNCTLRYTCRKINNDPKYYSFKGEYIPTV